LNNISYFCRKGDVSSAGSERMLHTHEVDGSIPLRPTSEMQVLEKLSRMQKYLLLFAIVTLIAMASCTGVKNPVLRIEGGKIQGIKAETESVYVYKGIPYAAAPVGENRWREPQPVVPWEGIKIADSFGAPAPQEKHTLESFYGKEFFWQGDPEFSEDCLFLNVWTTAPGETDKKLPVAMWIHGGAYLAGWGTEPEMDGEAWAERGVILVTINYRLGIFGFLAHPELSAESPHKVSGNYGILDQLAAIKWIKNNIAQFGGDPDNIMIFGQSAGAGSVQTLVSSPLAKDLIAKAIIQSGGGISDRPLTRVSNTLADAEMRGKTIMDFGGYDNLLKMRAASTQDMMELNARYVAETHQWMIFFPIIDNYLTTADFSSAARAGKIADVPYMIGCTMDDLGHLASGIDTFCLFRQDQGRNAYAYQFARALPGDSSGAFHSSELWYIFHTLKRSWRPFAPADDALSLEMVDAWTNFTIYNDPNGQGKAVWTPYTKATPEYMVFKLNDAGTETASSMGQPLPPSVERKEFNFRR
jgi:para-nitrobenzyl esterase